MNRFASIFAASVASITSLCDAQTERPYMYIWADPGSSWNPQIAEHVSRICLVTAVADPEDAADWLRTFIEDQIDDGVTDREHVSVLLFDFGNWLPSTPRNSLLDVADEIDNPAPQWNPTPPSGSQLRYMQPWMTNGIANLQDWMEAFLARYDTLTYSDPVLGTVPLPVPARFHFDTEVSLSSAPDLNYTRILLALEQDTDRWNNTPVPGFGSATMDDLFDDAKAKYGWGDSSTTLAELLDDEEGPFDDDNRPVFLWYYSVCSTAVDGAMQQAAYSVIKSFDSQHASTPATTGRR